MRKLILTICLLLLATNVYPFARDFDHTNDEIDMGNNLNVTTGDVSLAAWVQMDNTSGLDAIISKKADPSFTTAGYYLYESGSSQLAFIQVADGSSNGSNGVGSGTTSSVNDGNWYGVCGTWDFSAQTATMFENGVQTDQDITSNVDTLTNTKDLTVGQSGNNLDDADGRIAFATVYLGDIGQVGCAEWTYKPESVVLFAPDMLLPMWGGDSPEIDLSSNNLTATVSGAGTSNDGPPVMFGGGLPL